jgi:uncharacterized protein DUF3616
LNIDADGRGRPRLSVILGVAVVLAYQPGAGVMRAPLLRSVVWAFLCAGAAHAQEPVKQSIDPDRVLKIASPILDDDGDTATDISGLACMPPLGGTFVCMIINDEDRAAQLIELDQATVTVKRRVPLIGNEPSSSTLGTEPADANCSDGKARFKELDGEAVAYAQPYFYIVGSHGCTRHSRRFRVSPFITARVIVDSEGRVVDAAGNAVPDGSPPEAFAETTYRLSDALRGAVELKDFFATDLMEKNGLNAEGAAVVDGRLLVGLRAPVIKTVDGKATAYLVSVRVDHLFSKDASPPPADTKVIPLAFGENTGVRDIARLDDKRLLVLTGPAQEQPDVPYGIWLLDLTADPTATPLAILSDVVEGKVRGKAEALAVLTRGVDTAVVVVFFDALPSGAPRIYSVPVQQPRR